MQVSLQVTDLKVSLHFTGKFTGNLNVSLHFTGKFTGNLKVSYSDSSDSSDDCMLDHQISI